MHINKFLRALNYILFKYQKIISSIHDHIRNKPQIELLSSYISDKRILLDHIVSCIKITQTTFEPYCLPRTQYTHTHESQNPFQIPPLGRSAATFHLSAGKRHSLRCAVNSPGRELEPFQPPVMKAPFFREILRLISGDLLGRNFRRRCFPGHILLFAGIKLSARSSPPSRRVFETQPLFSYRVA